MKKKKDMCRCEKEKKEGIWIFSIIARIFITIFFLYGLGTVFVYWGIEHNWYLGLIGILMIFWAIRPVLIHIMDKTPKSKKKEMFWKLTSLFAVTLALVFYSISFEEAEKLRIAEFGNELWFDKYMELKKNQMTNDTIYEQGCIYGCKETFFKIAGSKNTIGMGNFFLRDCPLVCNEDATNLYNSIMNNTYR